MEKEDILVLEKLLHTNIPEIYKDFLFISNGLNVFNSARTLFGKQSNYKRDTDIISEPFDIITPNTTEKPKNSKCNIFIIGYYNYNGSYLYIDKKDSSVHLCQNNDSSSLYQWKSFEEMLYSEILRLKDMFDENGREKNEDKSTLPI